MRRNISKMWTHCTEVLHYRVVVVRCIFSIISSILLGIQLIRRWSQRCVSIAPQQQYIHLHSGGRSSSNFTKTPSVDLSFSNKCGAILVETDSSTTPTRNTIVESSNEYAVCVRMRTNEKKIKMNRREIVCDGREEINWMWREREREEQKKRIKAIAIRSVSHSLLLHLITLCLLVSPGLSFSAFFLRHLFSFDVDVVLALTSERCSRCRWTKWKSDIFRLCKLFEFLMNWRLFVMCLPLISDYFIHSTVSSIVATHTHHTPPGSSSQSFRLTHSAIKDAGEQQQQNNNRNQRRRKKKAKRFEIFPDVKSSERMSASGEEKIRPNKTGIISRATSHIYKFIFVVFVFCGGLWWRWKCEMCI